MLKLMQFAIVVAVIGSNGQYGWTPNGYVAGLIAVGAAFLATLFVMGIREGFLLLKQFSDQRRASRRTVGQRPVHELIGQVGLDRTGHNGPSRQRLGHTKQARIQ